MTETCYYNRVMEQIVSINKTSYTGEALTLYRGENERFPSVSTKLWRHYSEHQDTWESKSEKEKQDILDKAENEILKAALNFMGDVKTFVEIREGHVSYKQLEILAEIQHAGGITNFIDFTRNPNIALFFACIGNNDKDGRIIAYHHDQCQQPDHGMFIFPNIGYSRSQSSVLVRPKIAGVIDTNESCIDVIDIPVNKKQEIFDHLVHIYDVGITTVFSDLHGYIRNQKDILSHE